MTTPCTLASECQQQGWNPLTIPGQRGWWRTVSAGAPVSLIGLVVWEEPNAEGWEWEILEKEHDRHVAGGRAPTARGALHAVIEAARDVWDVAAPGSFPGPAVAQAVA